MAAPKRGPKGKRVGWSKLSRSYRARLNGAGISRTEWEAGVDLRTARGRAPAPPVYQAPADLGRRIVAGDVMPADLERAREWAESKLAPSWTRGLDADVAAALSRIPYAPNRWADVVLTPAGDDQPWTMRVIPKGRPSIGVITDRGGRDHAITAYDVVIEIPGGGSPGSGARQVLDLLMFGPDDYDQEWETIDFDLTESE